MQKFALYRNLLVIGTSATLWFAPALLHATELHPLIVTGIALDKVTTVHPAPVYPRVALALGIEGIVQIEVAVQNGRIIEANVISGSPLLAYSAKEKAAPSLALGHVHPTQTCLQRGRMPCHECQLPATWF
jgi:hypothetical protein